MKNVKKVVNFLKENADIWLLVGIALFLSSLWLAIFNLGKSYQQDTVISFMTASAIITCLIAHGASASDPLSRVRLVHGLAFAGLMIITITLSAFYVIGQSPQLKAEASKFLQEFVELGKIFYSALFGIGIAISLTAVVATKATRVKPADSGAAAIAGMATNFAIVLAIATSSIHLYNFGVNIAKLQVIETLAATIMADIAFLAIKANIQTQIESRQQSGRFDFFDLAVWSVFGILIAVYLILINAFTVAESSGIAQDMSLRAFIVRAYGMSPTVLLLGIASLTILTKTVDYYNRPKGAPQKPTVAQAPTSHQSTVAQAPTSHQSTVAQAPTGYSAGVVAPRSFRGDNQS